MIDRIMHNVCGGGITLLMEISHQKIFLIIDAFPYSSCYLINLSRTVSDKNKNILIIYLPLRPSQLVCRKENLHQQRQHQLKLKHFHLYQSVDLDFSKVKLKQFLTISYAALRLIFGFFHLGAGWGWWRSELFLVQPHCEGSPALQQKTVWSAVR